jgi:hypothetical protein
MTDLTGKMREFWRMVEEKAIWRARLWRRAIACLRPPRSMNSLRAAARPMRRLSRGRIYGMANEQ